MIKPAKAPKTTPSAAPAVLVFMRSHPAYAYNAGDRAVLAPDQAALLIEGGFARFDTAETAVVPTDELR